MKTRTQWLVALIFVVVLATPMVLMVAGVRPDLDENRRVEPLPGFDRGAVLDDATYAQLTAYLTDRLPLRDVAVDVDARIDEAITITDPLRPDVPRGADGWLYHHDTLLDSCPNALPGEFIKEGGPVFKMSKASGVDFLFVVVPDKVSVYPGHMPVEGLAGMLGLTDDREPDCPRRWRTKISEAAQTRPWLESVSERLLAAADASSDLQYLRLDTHFTDAGALHYAEAVVDGLAPGLWDPAAVVAGEPREYLGDLTRLRGEPETEVADTYEVVRPGVTVTYQDVDASVADSAVGRAMASSDGPQLIEGTTLLVVDSFGRRSLPLYAPYFEEIVLVSRGYLIDHAVESFVDRKPDTVVVEMVQRNMAKGWYREPLEAVEQVLVLD